MTTFSEGLPAGGGVGLSGRGGYEPGRIAETHDYVLADEDAAAFLRLVEEARNYTPAPESDDIILSDGARWVVEISGEADYQAWSTYGPIFVSQEPLSELMIMLVELSRFDIPQEDFY